MKQELDILFDALCDGLKQEARQRYLAKLTTCEDFSLINEREVGIASSLASHLRSVGFGVQLDAYFPSGDSKRRPDFGIWLPASRVYIYLELKLVGWGDSDEQYSYLPAIRDLDKLDAENDEKNLRNGLLALGFSMPDESPGLLENGFTKLLSSVIADKYPQYEEIGLKSIDFESMDKHSRYAMIGMWFRKHADEVETG